MSISFHERVGKALDLLRQGLAPFIEREFVSAYKEKAEAEMRRLLGDDRNLAGKPVAEWDVAGLLKLLWEGWNEVFRRILGAAERSLVAELRDVRNRWAHQRGFSADDAYRALDSASRLLGAISAPQAAEVDTAKSDLLRFRFEEQTRAERRKAGASLVDSPSSAVSELKPWREVVTPHADVASGRYQQAEFAADLWQVHLKEGSDEYKHPAEFFRRTFLTESLKKLLTNAVLRLSGQGGDPVVQLQTNFGGGKTHSMLALYHLFSGVPIGDLVGMDALLAEADLPGLPKVKRVVLVGNKLSPGNPVKKKDGTVVRTLWGELAYQLGGAKAYARIAADDEKATSPGDRLRELFNEFGPCLVLIDEWVAYARQLHDQSDLPAGSFETQFSFAQALTESAKLAKHCLLVISLPASDTTGSPHAQSEDVEVGGVRGREALDRLRNVVGRVESSWRPATAEEGFEIVRRRLFEPLESAEAMKQRDTTARAFGQLYRTLAAEFPPECHGLDYEKRIQAAYPIHPEIFDRLYTDWSTLVKFQRTRGVLRLMAAVIHSLWERGDKNPLILPSTLPIDDRRVQFELTRYLSDIWVPVLEKDVDGPGSLPLRIDAEVPTLGKLHAARRVARTVYLGSAPTLSAAHRGLEDRRVKLGCTMPGESPSHFGDALRRLSAVATYLYQDGPRVWYSTQPTVTKLAEDRAEELKRDPDKVFKALEQRIQQETRRTGAFARVHALPVSGADVADEREARLVILPIEYAYSKEPDNRAETEAKAIWESRGSSPRIYRNALSFLAADRVRVQDLEEALRKYFAWKSIVDEAKTLNLDPHQKGQAERQCEAANDLIAQTLPETYCWILAPVQDDPAALMKWDVKRLTGSRDTLTERAGRKSPERESLAERASKKLSGKDLLIEIWNATELRQEMDRIPLWRGDFVPVRKLMDDYASFPYLPRLAGPRVLAEAIQKGLGLLTWEKETFAYAEGWDEKAGRFLGLRTGQTISISAEDRGILVKPEAARRQMEAELPPLVSEVGEPLGTGEGGRKQGPRRNDKEEGPKPISKAEAPKPRRYFGTVRLDPIRVERDAGRVAEEVIAHLTGLAGAEVRIMLEIEASIPEGAPEHVVRVVTANSGTLKFVSHGFEKE